MDVNMLIASQVLSVYKDLTIIPVKTAYPRFQEKLTWLLKCTFRESVRVNCIGSSAFYYVMLIVYHMTDFAYVVHSFQVPTESLSSFGECGCNLRSSSLPERLLPPLRRPNGSLR